MIQMYIIPIFFFKAKVFKYCTHQITEEKLSFK